MKWLSQKADCIALVSGPLLTLVYAFSPQMSLGSYLSTLRAIWKFASSAVQLPSLSLLIPLQFDVNQKQHSGERRLRKA